MAELSTLADWAKSRDPKTGKQQKMAEVLHNSHPMLGHFHMKPSNLPTGHLESIRTDLPEVFVKRVNEGVPSTKSSRSQITEGISLFESWATHEEDALRLSGDMAAARQSEVDAHMEAMAQKAEETLLYGNTSDDSRLFNGIMTRYDTLSGNTQDNVIDCGGLANDNTSVLLVVHAPDKIFTIYPADTQAGMFHRDFELDAISDPTGNGFGAETMAGYRDQMKLHFGLAIKDPRFLVRLCNIKMPDLMNLENTQDVTKYQTALPYVMARAMKRIPVIRAGTPKWYLSRSAYEGLDAQCHVIGNQNVIKTREVDGQEVETFRGIELCITDSLRHTETAVA